MNLTLKILACILMILLILLIVSYLVATRFGKKGVLEHNIRPLKSEVPVTFSIGWWAYQEGLSIDDFQVEIVENRTNLFNSKSIISYQISGNIKYKGIWQPKIAEVHISERLNRDTADGYSRIIELTPVVIVEKNLNNKGEEEKIQPFSFTNEYIINSLHWGENKIKLVCGEKEQMLALWQRK